MTKKCCETNWQLTTRDFQDGNLALGTFLQNLQSLSRAYKKGNDIVTSRILGQLAKSMWECNLKKKYKWSQIQSGKLGN